MANHSYPSMEILFFCRERSHILAYCQGRLNKDLTGWAQRHIADCPACFPMAMRLLDAFARKTTAPPSEPKILDVDWMPVTPQRSVIAPSALAWVLVLTLLAASLALFIAALHRSVL